MCYETFIKKYRKPDVSMKNSMKKKTCKNILEELISYTGFEPIVFERNLDYSGMKISEFRREIRTVNLLKT
jgi:hypothetical protein